MAQLKKQEFLDLWGESTKHPIPLTATTAYKLFAKSNNKDMFTKETKETVNQLSDAQIKVILFDIANKDETKLPMIIKSIDEQITFLDKNRNLIAEKDIAKLDLRLDTEKTKESIPVKKIDTNGIMKAILEEPEILNCIKTDLLGK